MIALFGMLGAKPIRTNCLPVAANALVHSGRKVEFSVLHAGQKVNDVSLQKHTVRFPIDRAGFVGADGPTHCGAFDTTYLVTLPNMVVMAAADEAELKRMVHTAAAYGEGPISFRYPRGDGIGFSTSVADARFAKPPDHELLNRLATQHELLITVEEGSVGGFASHVMQALATKGLLDNGLKIRPLVLPDNYMEQASPEKMYHWAGLDSTGIVATALKALSVNGLHSRVGA